MRDRGRRGGRHCLRSRPSRVRLDRLSLPTRLPCPIRSRPRQPSLDLRPIYRLLCRGPAVVWVRLRPPSPARIAYVSSGFVIRRNPERTPPAGFVVYGPADAGWRPRARPPPTRRRTPISEERGRSRAVCVRAGVSSRIRLVGRRPTRVMQHDSGPVCRHPPIARAARNTRLPTTSLVPTTHL